MDNTNKYDFSQFSPEIVRLAAAQKEQESGGDYKSEGDKDKQGTPHSFGAYQWQPKTWQSHAKEAGIDPNDFSPDAQDYVAMKIAHNRIANSGYTPQEYLSEWNSGNRHAYANGLEKIDPHTGKKLYSVPDYVNNVQKNFNLLVDSQGAGPQGGGVQGDTTTSNKPSWYDKYSAQGDTSKSVPVQKGGVIQDTVDDTKSMYGKTQEESDKMVGAAQKLLSVFGNKNFKNSDVHGQDVSDFLEGLVGTSGYGIATAFTPLAHAAMLPFNAAGSVADKIDHEGWTNLKDQIGSVVGSAGDTLGGVAGKLGIDPKEASTGAHAIGNLLAGYGGLKVANALAPKVGSAGKSVMGKLLGTTARNSAESVASDSADALTKNIAENSEYGDKLSAGASEKTPYVSPEEVRASTQAKAGTLNDVIKGNPDSYTKSFAQNLQNVDGVVMGRARDLAEKMADNPSAYVDSLDTEGRDLLSNYVKQRADYASTMKNSGVMGRLGMGYNAGKKLMTLRNSIEAYLAYKIMGLDNKQ